MSTRAERTRVDLGLIRSWIKPQARVLDLGCGPGTLLADLATHKGCTVQGVEMDLASQVKAMARGVPVIGVDIDKQLDLFADASYDVVIMSRTLQAVRYPGVVLRHMMRIAPIAVVSMPNFGYWRNRLRLLGGHAPVSKDLPYQWHDSPNVHFGSSRDLEDLFDQIGLSILKCVALGADGHISRAPIRSRNWSAGAVVYELADQRQPLPSAGRR